MNWQHRLVKHGDCLRLCEVYFGKSDEPLSFCDADALEESLLEGDDEELRESCICQLYNMIDGAKKPILYYPADFTGSLYDL